MQSLGSAKADRGAVSPESEDDRPISHWARQVLQKNFINGNNKRIFNNAQVSDTLCHHSDRGGAG